MDDKEIEDLLRRYQPIGPPSQLRERILATAPDLRIWPWASSAAALLVVAAMFHMAGRRQADSVSLNLAPTIAERMSGDLTEILGGDSNGQIVTEYILIEQQLQSELAIVSPGAVAALGEEMR